MKIIFSPLTIILIFCPLWVWGQKSGEILINVTAENRKTGFVKDLKAEDLKIKFGKSSPAVTSLRLNDGPASIGILFDVSGSTKDWKMSNGLKPSLFLEGLKEFVNSSNSSNEYFVVGFNQKTALLVDKSQSHDPVIKALDSLRDINPEGNTSFYDALGYGLENLFTAKFKRRILLIISDGTDNTSKLSFDDMKKMLRESDIALYSLCIDPTLKLVNVNGMQGMAFLDELTWMSGGRPLYVRQPNDITKNLEKISSELQNQYSVGFVPKEPKKGTWNKLKIEILSAKGSDKKEGKTDLRYREGLIY